MKKRILVICEVWLSSFHFFFIFHSAREWRKKRYGKDDECMKMYSCKFIVNENEEVLYNEYTRNSETIRENNNGLIHGEEKRPYMSKLDEKHRWRVCHFAWMQYHFFRSRKRWRLEATWIKQRDNGHDNDFIERKWKSESGKVQRCTTMR